MNNAGLAQPRVLYFRIKTADANSFLYLCKAIQLFGEGHSDLAEALRSMKARALIIVSRTDLIFNNPEYSQRAAALLQQNGTPARYVEIEGDNGHAEGVVGIAAAGEEIRRFLRE